jgi:hypothetical protein
MNTMIEKTSILPQHRPLMAQSGRLRLTVQCRLLEPKRTLLATDPERFSLRSNVWPAIWSNLSLIAALRSLLLGEQVP